MGYLEQHLKKYPLMQIDDKIKLLMQGTLGPAHLINDKEQVRNRIYAEYEQIKDIDYEYDLVEHISDKFVRIYLKPFYERFKTFDNLISTTLIINGKDGNMNDSIINCPSFLLRIF